MFERKKTERKNLAIAVFFPTIVVIHWIYHRNFGTHIVIKLNQTLSIWKCCTLFHFSVSHLSTAIQVQHISILADWNIKGSISKVFVWFFALHFPKRLRCSSYLCLAKRWKLNSLATRRKTSRKYTREEKKVYHEKLKLFLNWTKLNVRYTRKSIWNGKFVK